MSRTYDDWKTEFPEEELDECGYCGEACNGRFCNKECEMAYIADNTDRSDD